MPFYHQTPHLQPVGMGFCSTSHVTQNRGPQSSVNTNKYPIEMYPCLRGFWPGGSCGWDRAPLIIRLGCLPVRSSQCPPFVDDTTLRSSCHRPSATTVLVLVAHWKAGPQAPLPYLTPSPLLVAHSAPDSSVVRRYKQVRCACAELERGETIVRTDEQRMLIDSIVWG